MKIIVSHDVDHLFWSEHVLHDLYIPKLWLRSLKLVVSGVIDAKTFFKRIDFWSDKRINRLEELMSYETALNIPATYFFVMRKGLGVSYEALKSKPFIDKVLSNGFKAGVHGMAYKDVGAMKEEAKTFTTVTGIKPAGVRMHYLRNNAQTVSNLAEVGYAFDSTEYKVAAPYNVNGLIEFPISVMDAYAVRPGHKNLDTAKAYTLSRLAQAEKDNIGYFTINFHDLVFDPAYQLYKDWFTWLIDLCMTRGYDFINFEQAMKEYHENKAIHS